MAAAARPRLPLPRKPTLTAPPKDPALEAALAELGRAHDVRHGEVLFTRERKERIVLRDGRPELVTSGSHVGASVRVLGDKTWGFSCTADLTEGGLVRCAREAIAVARASSRVATSAVVFPPQEASVGTYATPLAIDPFTIPLADKLAALDAPMRALLAFGKPLQSAETSMEWTRVEKHMRSTEGSDTWQSFTYGSCAMQVIAVDDAGNTQCRSYPAWPGTNAFQGGYERIADVNLLGHATRIAEEARDLLRAAPCPSGVKTVILESSQVALQIHESCGHPTELDRALGSEISLAGGSFLQPGLLGSFEYGSPIVDLVADSTARAGLGTFGWDDEGTPAGTHPLVQAGRFVDYLSSRETAAQLGRASTGTMRADGYDRTPLIRMVNVSLQPRQGTLDDLIADTKDGIYLECDRSWSIDDLRLNFQFSCELAWEIKNGKKTRLLRDALYTGITPRFWRSCDAICGPSEWKLWGINTCGKGDPMQMMHVGHGAAPARFQGVTVGPTGGGS
jgi:TldD protein